MSFPRFVDRFSTRLEAALGADLTQLPFLSRLGGAALLALSLIGIEHASGFPFAGCGYVVCFSLVCAFMRLFAL